MALTAGVIKLRKALPLSSLNGGYGQGFVFAYQSLACGSSVTGYDTL